MVKFVKSDLTKEENNQTGQVRFVKSATPPTIYNDRPSTPTEGGLTAYAKEKYALPTTGERIGSGAKSIGNTLLGSVFVAGETIGETAKAMPDYLKDKWSPEVWKRVGEDFRYILGDRDTPRTEVKNVEISDYGKIDADSFGMKRMDKAMEQRAEATKGLTGTKAFLADTALDIGQSAAILGAGLATRNPGVALGLMGATVGGQKAYEVAKEGGSAVEAYARGASAAGTEIFTEALPLDNLIDIYKKGGKSVLKNIAKQVGVEPTEEVISAVAGYLADKNAGDEDANLTAKDIFLAAVGGLLSAGVMSAGASAAGRLRNNLNSKKTTLPTKEATPETLPTTAQESVSTQESVVTPPEAKAPQSEVIQPKEAVLTEQPEAPVKNVAPVEPPVVKPAVTEVDTTAPEEASVGAAPANFTGNAVHSFTNRNIATDTARHIDIQKEEQVNIHKYWRLANEATLNKAKAVMDTGLDNAVATLEQAIGKSQAGMKFAPEMVPLSKMVVDSLAEQGKVAEADRLLASVAAELTEAGQLGQSAKILREASPSARIQTVSKVVEKLNQKVIGNQPNAVNTTEIDAAIREERDAAINIINEMIGAFGVKKAPKTLADYVDKTQKNAEEIDAYINAEKENGWVGTLAKELAQRAEKSVNGEAPKQQTTYQIVLNDLTTFMNEHIWKKPVKSEKRTAAARLADYFANRSEYNKAWNQARKTLAERYANDRQMLDALEEFLGATIDYNAEGSNAVMLRAITEVVLENDIKAKNLVMQGTYDAETLVSRIADDLTRKTGAINPSDKAIIKDAVARYVNEKVLDAKRSAQKNLATDIPKAVKDAGTTISQILAQDAQSKEEVIKKVADALISKYGISEKGAANISNDIIKTFNDIVAKRSQKKLEYLLKDKDKKLPKDFEAKMKEYINLGAFSSNNAQDAAKKLFGNNSIVVDEKLLAEYANGKTEKARDEALDKIYASVAEQIPSTFVDQFNALRYLNMLGNLKTQVRNVSGNTTMTIIRTVKDKIKAGLEQIAKKASGGKYQPTAALVTDKATRKLAEQDWQAHRDEALGEAKYTTRNGIPSAIYDKVTVFKNNGTWGKTEKSTLPMKTVRKGADLAKSGLEKARKATAWAMEKGDEVFSKSNYANALASYLKANGITSETFSQMLQDEAAGKGTNDILDKARTHAIKEAQKATFRDQNQISDLFAEIGFKNADTSAKKVANNIIHGVLPFRRTPANVMVRMVEYSPIGFVETTAKAILDKKKTGTVDWSEIIDGLAANLTGTGLFVLGMALQNAGKVTGGEAESEEQEKLNDLVGEENYTVEIGGQNYTVDFLSPASVAMMMGAEYEKVREETNSDLSAALQAAATITNPLLETSMLSGIRDAFDNVAYSENGMISFATNSLVNYLSQGLTSTLGGQIERTTQDERMSTFVDRNKDTGKETQYALGSASAKLPGYDYSQIPYIDAWGRTEKSKELPMRIAENFALPFYVSETNVTKADKEIQRLLDAGQSGVVPSKPSQSIKITYKNNPDDENEENKEKYLTADEYVKYSTVRGQTSYRVVSDLITLPEYKGLTDEEKADVIKKVYTYAGHLASEEVTGGKHDSDVYVQLAKTAKKELGLSESEYLVLAYKYPTLAGKESIRKAYANGVSPWEYAEYAQNGEKRYDKDNSGGVDMNERAEAISASGLSEEKQLALWKLAYPDWVEKAEEKGMPFDVYVKIKLGKY